MPILGNPEKGTTVVIPDRIMQVYNLDGNDVDRAAYVMKTISQLEADKPLWEKGLEWGVATGTRLVNSFLVIPHPNDATVIVDRTRLGQTRLSLATGFWFTKRATEAEILENPDIVRRARGKWTLKIPFLQEPVPVDVAGSYRTGPLEGHAITTEIGEVPWTCAALVRVTNPIRAVNRIGLNIQSPPSLRTYQERREHFMTKLVKVGAGEAFASALELVDREPGIREQRRQVTPTLDADSGLPDPSWISRLEHIINEPLIGAFTATLPRISGLSPIEGTVRPDPVYSESQQRGLDYMMRATDDRIQKGTTAKIESEKWGDIAKGVITELLPLAQVIFNGNNGNTNRPNSNNNNRS